MPTYFMPRWHSAQTYSMCQECYHSCYGYRALIYKTFSEPYIREKLRTHFYNLTAVRWCFCTNGIAQFHKDVMSQGKGPTSSGKHSTRSC